MIRPIQRRLLEFKVLGRETRVNTNILGEKKKRNQIRKIKITPQQNLHRKPFYEPSYKSESELWHAQRSCTFIFLAGYYLFVLQHVTIFAKSDLRFSDKNIALQTKRSKSTKSFFSDISNLCSRPVSTDEILFNLFSDLHKLESFNLN